MSEISISPETPWGPPVLPHEGPMRWIREARVIADGNKAQAIGRIGADHPFVRDGYLLPSAMIELLAQGAATGSAMRAERAGRRVKAGVLAAMREFVVHGPVPAESMVDLIAVHEKTFGQLSQVHLQARIGGKLVAEGRMTFHLTFE